MRKFENTIYLCWMFQIICYFIWDNEQGNMCLNIAQFFLILIGVALEGVRMV